MHRRTWSTVVVGASLAATLAGCSDRPTEPLATPAAELGRTELSAPTIALVRQLAAARGIGPLARPAPVRPELVRLGQLLAFDPILSGNRDIACTSCHLPAFATGDGKSLSVGQGGLGAGPGRLHPAGVFIPRNAPPLYNLGAMRRLFWDGRVEVDADGTLRTPAGSQLTPAMSAVFEFGAISALAMFPVANRAEMRAESGNELAEIADSDLTAIWAALMRRLGAVPEYRALFEAAYPGTRFDDMSFAHASNAIAGFVVDRLTFADTPWDRFLAGNDAALSARELEGARIFLRSRCATCHSGATFSNEEFHNVVVAQIGPGEGNGPSLRDDFGRMNVTGRAEDRYRFRTTPLRNVQLTAPYGHDGAITTLRGFVEHYSEADKKLLAYDATPLEPALRGTVLANAAEIVAHRDTLMAGFVLTDEQVDRLTDYMQALTDDAARNVSTLIPARVPSGLRVGASVR